MWGRRGGGNLPGGSRGGEARLMGGIKWVGAGWSFLV